MSAENTFLEIKQKVVDIIRKSNKNVTSDTSHRTGGVYMLYVNDFSDDKIIPFYIGQTTDFQRRYKQHISDIMRLNECSYAVYFNAFLIAVYSYTGSRCPFNGKYRPCKIFKYMVDHKCTMNDLCMIILEEYNGADIEDLERKYLQKYLPAFFGFNQIDSITERWRLTPEKYKEVAERDSKLFLQYLGYGFTEFNYLHSYKDNPHNLYKENLDQKINILVGNDMWKDPYVMLGQRALLLDNYHAVYEQKKLLMQEMFAGMIHEIFIQCKIKSKSRENDVISLLLNNYETKEVNDVAEIKNYLEYYMNRSRNCRECANLLKQLFEKHHVKISEINAPVMELFKAYVEGEKNAINNSRYKLIFPENVYDVYPLGEMV